MNNSNKMSSNILSDDLDLYRRAFEAYSLHSDKLQVANDWIDTELRRVTNSLVVTAGGVTRVLSIGPGDGQIENMFLKVIRDRNATLHPVKATIVEPSVCMVEKYRKRVFTEQMAELHDISYDWRTQTLDAYLQNGDNDGVKFHFISAMHSVYYFQDLPGTLSSLYNRLEPGGMMVLTVVVEKSFSEVTKKDRLATLTSQEVKAAFVMENIPIAHDFVTKERTNITGCFERPEDITEDMRLILDFLTNVIDFIKTASPEYKEEILGLLKSDIFSEKKNGKILFKGEWNTFIIIR